MKLLTFYCLTITFWVCLSGCDHTTSNKPKRELSTSVETLKRITGFKSKINSCTWELTDQADKLDTSVPGPKDQILIAEVDCDPADIEKIKTGLTASRTDPINSNIYLGTDYIKRWFTKNTKAIFFKDGKYIRINIPAYPLDKNLVGINFRDGFYCFVGDGKILLVLYR